MTRPEGLPGYYFAVVTRVPVPVDVRDEDGQLAGFRISKGNLALGSAWVDTEDDPDMAESLVGHGYIPLAPVFHPGEILLLGSDDREIIYPGRKPSKWDVEIEECDTLDEAVALSRRITDMDRY
jgi:hypothetical protein